MSAFLHHVVPSLGSTAARTACVMVLVFAGLRLSGKRTLGRMNIYDMVMILLISNAVQNAMTRGSGSLATGLVSALTLVLMGVALSTVFARLPAVGVRAAGTPTVLVDQGRVIRGHMRRESVTAGELMQAVRENGLSHVKDVALAVLEMEGTITIVPRDGVSGSGGGPRRI